MNDIEIHKAISDIEGGWTIPNPLTNDAYCFQLMVKYEICLRHDYGDVPWVCTNNNVKGWHSRERDPRKAICLAIIKLNTPK